MHFIYNTCTPMSISRATTTKTNTQKQPSLTTHARTNKFKNSIVLSHSFMFSGQGFSHHGSLLSILARVRVVCAKRDWRANATRAPPPWGVRRAHAPPTTVVVVAIVVAMRRAVTSMAKKCPVAFVCARSARRGAVRVALRR
jgi:hypothetical protein